MYINTIFTWQTLPPAVAAGCTCIVIDLLRATSTITAALAAGAVCVIPQQDVEPARSLARQLPEALLCGERNGVKIDGFQLGNSPLSFTPQTVGGKTLITTTTNGTKAILACAAGRSVLLGCLNNAAAVAAVAAKEGQNILILCAGTRGNPSYDDTLAAGAILAHLQQNLPEATWSDSCLMAQAAYLQEQNNLTAAVRKSAHGQLLSTLSMEQDVAFCARLNTTQLVPVFENGNIHIKK